MLQVGPVDRCYKVSTYSEHRHCWLEQESNMHKNCTNKKSKTLKCRRIGMATQIIKSNETSHVQVPMHHHTYTSTEAMTTAQVTVQCFMLYYVFSNCRLCRSVLLEVNHYRTRPVITPVAFLCIITTPVVINASDYSGMR